MSQINRSELALVAPAHRCLLQGFSMIFSISQASLQHTSLVMMDKLPWSVLCQSHVVSARLHPCAAATPSGGV